MARSRGGSRSSADPLAGYSDEQISNALSLGVIMGEERNNLGGMALIAAGALNRGQNPSSYYAKSSLLGDIFAAPHTARAMARSILTGQSLPNVKGKSRQYSATLPKEKDAFAAVKAGLTAALRGTPVPSQWQGRYDRAKVSLDIATKAKALGISLNMGAKNYGLASAPKAGFGPYAALFGEHKIGPFDKGKTPTQAELASRIAAAAAMTGVSIPRGMQAELDRYTTPAQIAATASVMQMEAGIKNPGTFPGYSYGAGSMVNKTGHAAVDVPAIRDADLHVTPQGLAGWGQPALSSLAGIPSAQQRSVGIPGEDPMGLPGWGVISDEAYRDYTDVLANEQLGVPGLPGPLAGMPAPEFSLQDLGALPGGVSYPDISRGILHDTDQARGFTGSLNTPDFDPNVGLQPDYSDISRAVFGDQAPRNGIGLGVTGYGPGALGTAAFPDIGPYDALAPARESFPDQAAPPVNDILNDAFGRDPFSSQPLGAPQGFGNWGNQDVGYPSGGFNTQPNRATDMSLAGMSPIGLGVAGVGYNPSAVAAASPIGAPSMRGMDFGQMTRGIVGYEDKPVTTTTQVPNPAYADWQEAFNNPKATTQQMYADDLADKIGVNRGNFATPAQVAQYGPAPSRTIGRTTFTTQRSPVYGDVPVGQPIGANLAGAGAGSWTSGLTNQAAALNANIMDMGNWGLQGFTGSFNTGLSAPVGYGGGIGSLGGLGMGGANVGSGWGLGGEAGGLGGTAGAAGFSGGDAGYGSDARSGRDGADQRND